MKNFKVYAPLVDGGLFPRDVDVDEMFMMFLGDDLRPPPRSLVFEATAADGRKVEISFWPGSDEVVVKIDGD